MLLTVEELKKHLIVDHNEDDEYISDLIDTALDAVGTYLNRPITDYVQDGRLKPSVKHACRLLIGTWYANREDVVYSTPSELPDGIVALLLPLRNFVTKEV